MTPTDANRVLARIRAGVFDELLPTAVVDSLRREARAVVAAAPQWTLRLDDGEVLHATALRRARKVPAVEIDEALCIASRRPRRDYLVTVGRTAAGELAVAAVLADEGWRQVGDRWRHVDMPDWVATSEDKAAHVWLSGAPRVEWEHINHKEGTE